MPYEQRDIVKVKRVLPTGEELVHPFIIISNTRAINHEPVLYYMGIMITHSDRQDKFSFKIDSTMVDGRVDDGCQVRQHILVGFRQSDISRDATAYMGKMKKQFFQILMRQICDNVLSID
jgi:hypothetical protein